MLAYGILSTSFINLGHRHRSRPRNGRAAATAWDAGDRVVVLHRQDHAGRHRESRRGRHPAVGGRTGLSTPSTYRRLRMVHADVGVHPGHRQLFAAGHLRQQPRQQRRFCRRHHQRSGGRPAVRVGHLCAAHGAADVDVDRWIDLSRQVDGSGIPVGAAAAADGRLRTGRQLGALADIPGAGRVEYRRTDRVPQPCSDGRTGVDARCPPCSRSPATSSSRSPSSC